MRLTLPALLLLSLASLAGACDPLACDTMAYTSVNVTVTDDSGSAVPDVEVTFSVDGGAASPCEVISSTEFGCGVEQAGDITVEASAPGFVTQSDSVTVDEDECHVLPETMDFELVLSN